MDHDEIFYQQLVLFLSLGFNVGPNTASAKSIRGLADSLVLGATEPADACVIDCGTGPWRTLCTYLQTSLSTGVDFDTAMEDYSFTPMELDAMDDGSNSTALEMGPPPGGPSGPDPAAPAKTEPDRKTPTGESADSPDDKPGSPSDSSPDSPDDPPTGPSDSSPDSPDDPPTGPTGESKDSPDSPDEPPTGPTGPSDTGPSDDGPSDSSPDSPTGPSGDGPLSPSKYVV